MTIMADEPDNLIVRYLRRLDEKVDRLLDDMREVKQRLSSVEVSVAHLLALSPRSPAVSPGLKTGWTVLSTG